MKKLGRSLVALLLVALLVVPGLSMFSVSAANILSSAVAKYQTCGVAFDLNYITKSENSLITMFGMPESNGFQKTFFFKDLTANLLQFTKRTDTSKVYSTASTGSSAPSTTVANYRGRMIGYFDGLGNYSNMTNFPHTQEGRVEISNAGGLNDLVFSYYLDDGKLNPNDCTGCILNTDSSTVIVRAGATATLSFTSPMGDFNRMFINMYNFKVVDKSTVAWVTFNGAEHCSVSVGSETLTAGQSSSQAVSFADGIALDCVSVEDGYEFIGFLDSDNNFIPAGTYYPTNNKAVTPLVVKTSDDMPVYGVDNKAFTDFNQAISYASSSSTSKRIIVIHEGTLAAGNYTIPAGVSLLVPFDDAHTMYTDKPGTIIAEKITTRTAYCTFTLAPGVHLNVDGAISVSAKHPSTTASASPRGAVGDSYGWLYMNAGSDITLNDGANLYAWGFVTGDGSITAHSGATVYEYFQVNDFRGGTITSNMASNSSLNQFPFNQYYVQNIESRLRIEQGASERVCLELYAASQVVALDLEFIGDSDGMFVLEDEGTYLEKYYDYAHDKMKYELGGSASISQITLSLAGITISSESFYLPITNIDFTIKEGGTLTTDKDIIFLPGSSVTIEEGGFVEVADGGSVVFAAKDDVVGYSASGGTLKNPCWPVIYTPTPHPTRTWATIEEPYVDNNGEIVVDENGSFAATSPAAEIYSSDGTGVLQMNGANDQPITLTKYVSASTVDGQTQVNSNDVATIPAVVQDAQGGSESEEGHSTSAVWGTPARIRKNSDGIYGDYREVTWINLDGSVSKYEAELSYDAYLAIPASELPEIQAKPTDDYGRYNTVGWKIDTVTTTAVTIVPEYELIPNNVTITWLDWDGSPAPVASSVFSYNSDPSYPTALYRDSDAQYEYTFWGWTDGTNEYEQSELPKATKDVTYTAVYTTELCQYVVYWLVSNPAHPDDIECDYYLIDEDGVRINYGDQFVYPNGEPPVLAEIAQDMEDVNPEDYTDYIFTGWTVDGVFYPVGTEMPVCHGYNENSWIECYACYVQRGAASGNAYFSSHTISLDGSIGINYYIALPDGANAGDFEISHSFRGETAEAINLSGCYDDSKNAYKYTVRVDSPQMTEDVTAVLYRDGDIVDVSVFNVADYSASLNAADEEVEENCYYLVGTIGGENCWPSNDNVQTKYKFVMNPSDANEYMLQYVELSAGDQIKVAKKTSTGYQYYPDQWDYQTTDPKGIDEDGTYTIYFRPNCDGNPDPAYGWYYKYFYVGRVAPLRKLVRNMLNMGGASQAYFADKYYAGYISDDSAAAYIVDPETYPEVTDEMLVDRMTTVGTDLTTVDLSAYGLQYYGSSAVLNTNTALRIYFKVTDEVAFSQYGESFMFGFDGSEEPVTGEDDSKARMAVAAQDDTARYIYIEYNDIAAAKLDDTVVLKVGDTELFHQSVMDYLRKARNSAINNEDDRLMNLVSALYYYNLAADEYFNFAA